MHVKKVGVFPFGQPIHQLSQIDRSPKKVFVLGVYASAVHARWIGANGQQKIAAVAVASEPEIFWRGSEDTAQEIISKIKPPKGAGSLVAASSKLNGPSGKALDELFLEPLSLNRDEAWLCDLVPHSCMNLKQELALKREYDPLKEALGLTDYNWPHLPSELADAKRRQEILRELMDSKAKIIITLGDLPLKWFTKQYGSFAQLRSFGQDQKSYGKLHPLTVGDQSFQLLPLVHPRQAARLGNHSATWAELHGSWAKKSPRKMTFA
jgi:uracil-DNA glycosylase